MMCRFIFLHFIYKYLSLPRRAIGPYDPVPILYIVKRKEIEEKKREEK